MLAQSNSFNDPNTFNPQAAAEQYLQEIDVTSKAVGSAGVAATGLDIFVGDWTLGINNFRVYSSGWRGNQYVATRALGAIADIAGVATLGLGTALDAYSWYMGAPNGGLQFGTNLGVGLYGLSGGPFTAVPAAAYFLINSFYPGGIPGALTDYGNISIRMQQIDPTWNLIQ